MDCPPKPWVPYLDGIVRDRQEIADEAARRIADEHELRGERRRLLTLEQIATLDRWT
jgi:hypothetical protein